MNAITFECKITLTTLYEHTSFLSLDHQFAQQVVRRSLVTAFNECTTKICGSVEAIAWECEATSATAIHYTPIHYYTTLYRHTLHIVLQSYIFSIIHNFTLFSLSLSLFLFLPNLLPHIHPNSTGFDLLP